MDQRNSQPKSRTSKRPKPIRLGQPCMNFNRCKGIITDGRSTKCSECQPPRNAKFLSKTDQCPQCGKRVPMNDVGVPCGECQAGICKTPENVTMTLWPSQYLTANDGYSPGYVSSSPGGASSSGHSSGRFSSSSPGAYSSGDSSSLLSSSHSSWPSSSYTRLPRLMSPFEGLRGDSDPEYGLALSPKSPKRKLYDAFQDERAENERLRKEKRALEQRCLELENRFRENAIPSSLDYSEERFDEYSSYHRPTMAISSSSLYRALG